MSPSGNVSEIEISEKLLQRIGEILLAFVVVFTVIGKFASPHDENGKPVVLLPEVKSFEEYRRTGKEWISQMRALGSEISGVLAGEHAGDMFTQSRQAQQMLQSAVSLSKEIDQEDVPVAAAGIHDQLYTTSMLYLETARLTMRWVAAPEAGLKQEIDSRFEEARTARNALEQSQWLNLP